MNFPICSVCDTALDFKEHNDSVLNGFIDADTQEIVHLSCKTGHYVRKAKTPFAGMYSELPLTKRDLKSEAEVNVS